MGTVDCPLFTNFAIFKRAPPGSSIFIINLKEIFFWDFLIGLNYCSRHGPSVNFLTGYFNKFAQKICALFFTIMNIYCDKFTASRLANIWHLAVKRSQSAPVYMHTILRTHVHCKFISVYNEFSLATQQYCSVLKMTRKT